MEMPSNDAPLADIVAYCKWNDHNGCWPEHYNDSLIKSTQTGEVVPPPSALHVWYDWEFDRWYTDDELRVHMVAVLDHWRADL